MLLQPPRFFGSRFVLPLLLASSFVPASSAADTNGVSPVRPLYLDPSRPLETRVEDLLPRLTLEEKISLVHGDSSFSVAGVPRLGIPERYLSDGPLGVREAMKKTPAVRLADDFSTAMPAGICLAATWNPELARAEGEAIGQEARARGKDIMLGPAVNIFRTPLCGRNFEYFGEDPFLAGRIAVGYIHGEQSQDVASCVKHFAANNQEYGRNGINEEISARALREIYLPAFRVAVQEGGAWCVMAAYNKVRGQFCAQNDYLLNHILKGDWGFQGLVMSDWGATHNTRQAALHGLDLEMGTSTNWDNFHLARPYLEALKKGELPVAGLDDKVRRNLRVMFATHMFDPGRTNGSLNTVAHQLVSRRVAEEGIVLLKNERHLLPLDPDKIHSIAVIGENAVRLQDYGGGSSRVKSFYEVTPLEGLVNRAGRRVNIIFSEGYERNGGAELAERAVAAAKAADVVIYVGGLNHRFDREGADRRSFQLSYGQDELIRKIAAANPRTVVVLLGTPVEMGAWLDRVPAVLQAWYLGMEGGNALARILFGDADPSGRLPCTIPKRLADSPAFADCPATYPGTNGTVTYKEGLLVGYRWFDTKHIQPQFPFGFGLNYTTFKYSGLKLIPGGGADGTLVTAQFEIENTGPRPGAEVAELYVHENHPDLPRPEKELKGFKKVFLKPGEKEIVSIPLNRSAFAYYDPAKNGWVAQKDKFKILIGASSRDIRLRGAFRLAEPVSFR
ncbi:MAG: glycoside hydrolase family 3 C-terminal domain-containing protein [Verrucomicrobiota bacterium]|nr:glycoside hydrolase family 3 C-terminal domain-containing protein [Verrucomicrobiota bacterium]